jgi:signal transduction histidine kinase
MQQAAHGRLVRTTSRTALLVALATLIAIPVIYFGTALSYEKAHLRGAAEQLANRLARIVYIDPEHWRFQQDRLEGPLSYGFGLESRVHRRIVDPQGHEIISAGPRAGSLSAKGTAPLTDGEGGRLATIEVSESLWPVLFRTGGVALISVILSLAIYSALKVLPLRALDKVIGELGRSEMELRCANQAVTQLNAVLERRVAERSAELERAQEELLGKQRLATLGQVTATVSHELRNPLGAVRNSVFLIAEKVAGKELGLERMLDRTERNIARCDKIVGELLDYTRGMHLKRKSAALDPWLEGLLAEQEMPEGITLRKELGAPGLELPFDADRLRRAVINVFDNACQAMTEAVRTAEDGWEPVLTVRSAAFGDRARLCFIDNGPGMAPEVQERVFEPLYSTKSFGVGLGMPTVKQIMEQHGGGIEITSAPGRGTEVLLWLPSQTTKEVAA